MSTIYAIIFFGVIMAFILGCQQPVAQLIPGPDGERGLPGTNGTSGLSITGPQGPIGLSGTSGVSIVGPMGPAGTPGTIVTMVQFCPGTTVYPTSFPEYGFIINGHLYAVYSANDGFLAEIVPGLYESNAIGNSCTFTVHSGGSISH